MQGPLPRLVAVQASGCAPSSRPGSRGARVALLARLPDPGVRHQRAQGAGDFLVLDASIAPRAAPSRWKMAPSSANCVNSPLRRAASSARKGRPPSPPPASCGKRAGSRGRAGGGAQHRRWHQVPGRHHGRAPAAAPRRRIPA
ncbi:hypothetical protein H2136_16980 [Aeromonas hydrophila]|uniref:Uncharacterized protein n=1 Tax=Aeromonas hydrophila TaxID=644 RepID=A0A926FP11_AERHY|nr:hypothetical protein [Aeromonas hydrophila]